MRKSAPATLLAALLFPCAILAQTGTEASLQKTIEISATEKVQVPAETATVKLGYQNQSSTKDAAYADNVRTANKIVQALIDAGVPKDAIETESLSLARDEDRFGGKPQQPSTFTATQQWQIHAKAGEAQKIVDVAVAAGANQIESVDWSVADPQQLDDRAYGAALARAKTVAEQTAAHTGVKLGAIISVSNSVNPAGRFRMKDKELMTVEVDPDVATPMLKLLPGTVERQASVTVTYAIAP